MPSQGMRLAMQDALLGDDVFGKTKASKRCNAGVQN